MGSPREPIDEDQKAVNVIEESATRSDVVYGFAEVKYKQLIHCTFDGSWFKEDLLLIEPEIRLLMMRV